MVTVFIYLEVFFLSFFLPIWDVARGKKFYHIHPANMLVNRESFGAMVFKYKFVHSLNAF